MPINVMIKYPENISIKDIIMEFALQSVTSIIIVLTGITLIIPIAAFFFKRIIFDLYEQKKYYRIGIYVFMLISIVYAIMFTVFYGISLILSL